MDILKAEIARKRKLLEEKKLIDEKKKYFKRGDLQAIEDQQYLQECGQESKESKNDKDVETSGNLRGKNSSANDKSLDAFYLDSQSSNEKNELVALPRAEVIQRLRDRGEPILLFGELEMESFKRLRKCEILEPEVNRGFRNDFQEAMEKVDQVYLDELLKSNNGENGKEESKESKDEKGETELSYDAIKEMSKSMGRGNRELDMKVVMTFLKFLLKMWGEQLNSRSQVEKMGTKGKMTFATFTQTQVYLKPLLQKLKNRSLPEDISDSLTEIIRHLLNRNYIMASDAYLQMAIGNAPWPIGVTMVGIHARTGREKIFSKNVAHVMNDETQRKYIQALKRLMTKCQEFFPTDPSRCVEYAAFGNA